MLRFKRNMLSLGDFEYLVSDTSGATAKVSRHKEGMGFYYASQGCEDNFTLTVNRKFVPTDSIDDDIRTIAASYATARGMQGQIFRCGQKGFSLFKNYIYWAMPYGDQYYRIYAVGRKSEGTFFCVYAGNVLVAMIRKDPEVYGRSTQYEIYSENFVAKEALLLMAVYVDLAEYYPNPSDSARSTECRITLQKELKAKYDPTFIPRIKALEGIVD